MPVQGDGVHRSPSDDGRYGSAAEQHVLAPSLRAQRHVHSVPYGQF
jgi:hypothetical protein